MKELSLRQAATCETAKHPRCRCRCQGLAHGRSVVDAVAFDEITRNFFEGLEQDDPHRISTKEERKNRSRRVPPKLEAPRFFDVLEGARE